MAVEYLGTGNDDGVVLGRSTSDLVGMYGVTPVDQGAALTTQLTTVTHSEPSTPDYAIQDLTTSTPYGFVTADEGQTVLKVIANLQTRLAEVESRLQDLGAIA